MHNFRKLEVWHRSRFFARDVYHLTIRVRRSEHKILSTQLLRAALAIPSAICEGCGKRTRAETIRYLDMAHGSATESEGHLQQAIDIAILPERYCHTLMDESVQIQRMISALMQNLPPDP
jgi:four helix bundle protein